MTFKKGSTDPCKQEACAIQTCLKHNNFVEDKCRDEIENLKQCCREWFANPTKTYQSDCCSGFTKEFEKQMKQKSK